MRALLRSFQPGGRPLGVGRARGPCLRPVPFGPPHRRVTRTVCAPGNGGGTSSKSSGHLAATSERSLRSPHVPRTASRPHSDTQNTERRLQSRPFPVSSREAGRTWRPVQGPGGWTRRLRGLGGSREAAPRRVLALSLPSEPWHDRAWCTDTIFIYSVSHSKKILFSQYAFVTHTMLLRNEADQRCFAHAVRMLAGTRVRQASDG